MREVSCIMFPIMKKEVKGAVLTTLGGVCWGISGSIGQYLFTYEGMDSTWLVPIRLGLAGLIILSYCAFKYKKLTIEPWKTRTNRKDLIVYGLLGISFCQFLYLLTIQLSSAATATILQDLSPLFILVYTCIEGRRTPYKNEIIAIVLALLGVFFISTHGDLSSTTISLKALLAGIGCAFCVMVYNCFPKKLLQQYPIAILQGWAFVMGGTFFALVFKIWTIHYVPSITGVLGIAFAVIIGNVMSFLVYMSGMQMIGPDKAILYGFSEPVTAAIISIVALGGTFTLWDALGFLLIFFMLALISKQEKNS